MFPQNPKFQATQEELKKFHTREPSISPNKLFMPEAGSPTKTLKSEAVYSSDHDEKLNSQSRDSYGHSAQKKKTKPQEKTKVYSKNSETVIVEETPKKEVLLRTIDRVSIDDYTSLSDRDCLSQIIRFIENLKRVEEI